MSERHVLPEISQLRRETEYLDQRGGTIIVKPEPFPTFPATCPACGAAATHRSTDWRNPASYACGAKYTSKPQIQNHTDKWWGSCPATKEA